MDDIEILVVLRGLQIILPLGFPRLLLEGDFFSMIEAIRAKEPNYSRHGNVIFEIQRILLFFKGYDVLHTGRQGNEATHLLASHARLVDETI